MLHLVPIEAEETSETEATEFPGVGSHNSIEIEIKATSRGSALV